MKKRLAFVVATPVTFKAFLIDHARSLLAEYDIAVISNFGCDACLGELQCFELIHFPIRRKISILSDIVSLFWLIAILCNGRFDIVHSVTPKAGFLSAIAGRLSKVPFRLHTFTGQVWATRHGVNRFFLKGIDLMTASLVSHVLADGRHQANYLYHEGFKMQIRVLADGSLGGVDVEKFCPNAKARSIVRSSIGIKPEEIVFIFVGRLNRDKGILDLVEAYASSDISAYCRLVILGSDEENLHKSLLAHRLVATGRIVLLGWSQNPNDVLAASDVLCLPSYREGFGTSVIEAAAVGLPSIVSRIYGLEDAVIDGETGLMHMPGSIPEIKECMYRLATDAGLRVRLGNAAKERAIKYFSANRLSSELRSFYCQL